ncbi:sodium:proton antiporter NhaD [Capnocytophaga catalasegens]|uniref:Sodium:proton antiporter n=1 Tax=Capnocytophaga catalasegens TaxID=1004260 RepID=A0AAV5AQ11_9FLAO|nr:sodium:proton antiporter NhaD [Capnocytophaga catalasegens]GIZ15044.1 sodium:proton antiporter [Capnocytophaga catalasegens]GJM49424.1 sodium:proton antiporter [Capnocytophaga catalasegens]GJM52574.1 sodium:proton antiporter [Capnocytophaga catalasegens]
MELLVVAVFFIGYFFITLEHQVKIDKTISALGMASVCWAILKLSNLVVFEIDNGLHPIYEGFVTNLGLSPDEARAEAIDQILLHHLGKIAEILFFLIGAMTIVEIIDMHRGFEVIKKIVKTRRKQKLLWIVGIISFFLSALIDNLTATIVLITIIRKLVPFVKERMWYASLIVIAANAGGAWSPIGDVTTTMLWMADKVTALKLSEYVLLPSILCFVIPFWIASFLPVFQGRLEIPKTDKTRMFKSSIPVLILGFTAIIFVPIFKSITHLPPYIGMLFALASMWFFSEFLKPIKELEVESVPEFTSHKALSRIELSSILFFLGILLAVASLESIGVLFNFAEKLNQIVPSQNLVIMLLGVGSSVIDNVPLVAASIGMFQEPIDSLLWHFIAYAAGTGGSLLIIGSAAGIAAMGMEKISFFWYLKNISWLAFIGFIAGALCLIAIEAGHIFG